MNSDFLGVFVPVVTPFINQDIQIDWLQENLDKLAESDVKGFLALGSNGEFMSLSEEEQLEVVKIFVRHKSDKILMVGTARESLKETIAFSQKVIDLGADYISLLTPHYFARHVNDDLLIHYYTEIAEQLSVPILLYNAPGFASGVTLSPQTVKHLSEHENIVGMKDSSASGMNGYLAELRDSDFSVLAGSANFFFQALVLGAQGGIISVANYLPELACKLHSKIVEQKYDEAVELHYKIFQINKITSGKYGVPGVKSAMNIFGFKGGVARSPLKQLSTKETQDMKRQFEEIGLI